MITLFERIHSVELLQRWGHTPQSEAERFGHHKIADYLHWWTVGRDESCDTLTAKGGEALLQKLAEINIQKQSQNNN